MAGDWLKWCKGLSRKREVRAVARKLGLDRRIIACACMEMWEWVDGETSDGHIQGATADDIDDQVSIPGFAGALADSEVGWLRITSRGISIPNFDRHNSKSAKDRALAQVRMQRSRCAGSATKPSPEKRREEKSKSPNGDLPAWPPWVDELWLEWSAFKREKGQAYKPRGEKAGRGKLLSLGEERARIAVEHSMACNWAGIFEPNDKTGARRRSESESRAQIRKVVESLDANA